MSKRLNELAEIVLDRVYTYGYQQRVEVDAQCRAEDELLAAQRKLADVTAERDRLAAEIETLRGELAIAKREASDEFAERQVLQHEASGDNAELERLRVCVRRVGEHVELFEHCPTSMRAAIVQDLADCATANPAQVSEPMDAEGGE